MDGITRFPKRKSPRLHGYNYANPNYYFVTICTHSKKCLFGLPGSLTHHGRIAEDALCQITAHFPGVRIEKSVVMPNHVHAIVVIEPNSADLTVIIGQYKAFVTKQIHQYAPDMVVWQTSFHDHIIRSQHNYEKIWNYIDANPVKWMDDCFYSANIT